MGIAYAHPHLHHTYATALVTYVTLEHAVRQVTLNILVLEYAKLSLHEKWNIYPHPYRTVSAESTKYERSPKNAHLPVLDHREIRVSLAGYKFDHWNETEHGSSFIETQRTVKHSLGLLYVREFSCYALPIRWDSLKLSNSKTVSMFNSLPDATKYAGCIDVFKSRLKTYLFSLSFCYSEFFQRTVRAYGLRRNINYHNTYIPELWWKALFNSGRLFKILLKQNCRQHAVIAMIVHVWQCAEQWDRSSACVTKIIDNAYPPHLSNKASPYILPVYSYKTGIQQEATGLNMHDELELGAFSPLSNVV